MQVKSNEYLFDLLKSIADKDREAADVAICNLRIELVKSDNMPGVIHSRPSWVDHHFEFNYAE